MGKTNNFFLTIGSPPKTKSYLENLVPKGAMETHSPTIKMGHILEKPISKENSHPS